MGVTKGILIDLFTNSEGHRADEMASLSIVGVLVFIGLAIYSVAYKGSAFDPTGYGTGLGAAIGGAAVGIGLKGKMERDIGKDGEK
jgi:hypothetical protein